MASTEKSLGEILKLIEDGVLVRNTKDDGNFAQFAIDSFRLTRVLKEAQLALREGVSRELFPCIRSKGQ